MKVNILPKIALIVALALSGVAVYQFMVRWQDVSFGGYEVRRNRLTGVAQVKVGEKWTDYQDDPYSEGIPVERMQDIRLTNVAWGTEGLLCVRAENRAATPFKGRVAFRIVQRKLTDSRMLPDRTLRVTVNIPPKTAIPLLIRTNLPTPDAKRLRTSVELQPVSYSGME